MANLTKKRRRPKATMPHAIQPMLATLVDRPLNRDGWYFEIKWDGFRSIAEIENRSVHLYSRNQKSFNTRFAPIVRSLRQWRRDAILDGEIVALDERGISHFQLLQQYQTTGAGTLVYYVFDLLFLNGADLRSAPLAQRKELLAELPSMPNVRVSEHVVGKGESFFKAALKNGLEGIIAKNAASLYQEGIRSNDWLKIKARKQQEAVIGGFTEPQGRRLGIGALVVGVFEGKDLVYVGHAGGGLDSAGLMQMRQRLDSLIQKQCPFKKMPKTNAPVHWVRPALVCEIAFQEWTKDGIMRQPIVLGLRGDKSARSVKREVPTSAVSLGQASTL